MPFFALSDADRASELRADADAIADAAQRPDALLLPLTGDKVWVILDDADDEGDIVAADGVAPERPSREHASPSPPRWIPAEVPLASIPPDLFPRSKLSFLGFKNGDRARGAPSSAPPSPTPTATPTPREPRSKPPPRKNGKRRGGRERERERNRRRRDRGRRR